MIITLLNQHANTNKTKNEKIGYVCGGDCRRLFPNKIIQPFLIAKKWKPGFKWCENCYWFYPYNKNTNSKMRRHICTGKCRKNLTGELPYVLPGRDKYKSGYKYCKSCKFFFLYKNNKLQPEFEIPKPSPGYDQDYIDKVIIAEMLKPDYDGYCPCCSCRLRTKPGSKYKKKETVIARI